MFIPMPTPASLSPLLILMTLMPTPPPLRILFPPLQHPTTQSPLPLPLLHLQHLLPPPPTTSPPKSNSPSLLFPISPLLLPSLFHRSLNLPLPLSNRHSIRTPHLRRNRKPQRGAQSILLRFFDEAELFVACVFGGGGGGGVGVPGEIAVALPAADGCGGG